MARQRKQDNRSFPRKGQTVDRQMVIPVDYEKSFFPVTSANPKRSELNPGERKSTPNTFRDCPTNPYGGTRRQSRY